MSRRRCCRADISCVECGDTITSDGWVSVFHHVVNDNGTITRVDKSYPCITYYVNSVSGGGAETGSGTEDDPWTNLNTVFSDSCIYNICLNTDCPRVKVLVKGTIDYVVVGDSGRNYERRLVLEPWDAETINIDIDDTGSVIALQYCCGCIFKHITTSGSGTGVGFGVYVGFGFSGCVDSGFDSCVGNGTGNSDTGCVGGVGFNDCGYSAFDNCEANGKGTCEGFGYYDCSESTFLSSFGNGIGGGDDAIATITHGYGFFDCPNSVFYVCTGSGTGSNGTSDDHGHGFVTCTSSVFIDCDGKGYTSGISDCKQSCGFWFNTSASFDNCSTTDRICTDGCVCDSFVCDI